MEGCIFANCCFVSMTKRYYVADSDGVCFAFDNSADDDFGIVVNLYAGAHYTLVVFLLYLVLLVLLQ